MIVVNENINFLDKSENEILDNLCGNFVSSETPNINNNIQNYYDRFIIDINSVHLKPIFEKLINFTKDTLKSYGVDPTVYEIVNNKVSINKITNETNKDDKFHTDASEYTTILYLNENYSGGEYEYIDDYGKFIKIKPKKNLIIVSDITTQHRVLPVIHGVRYSLICFFNRPLKRKHTLI